MASSMHRRTSLGEMMTNVWANGQYTLAGSMADNPVAYLIYKMASLLDSTVGGIGIPSISVVGSGVDLEMTVADLMRVGAMSAGVIGSLGAMISGLGSSFSGSKMLSKLGIGTGSGLAIVPRGDGSGLLGATGGGERSVSEAGYVGNSKSSDIKESVMQDAKDSKEQLMVEAQEEEKTNTVETINTNVLKIYELLDDVVHGNGAFRVKVDNYGLTKLSDNNNVFSGGFGYVGNGNSEPKTNLNGWYSSV
jgi:hypothetical protein